MNYPYMDPRLPKPWEMEEPDTEIELDEGGTAEVKDGQILVDLSECDLDDSKIYLTKWDLTEMLKLLERQ